MSAPVASIALTLAACGGAQPGASPPDADAAVRAVLDDWHAAAAASDEARYFDHFADDGVFLGTDATERWGVAAGRRRRARDRHRRAWK